MGAAVRNRMEWDALAQGLLPGVPQAVGVPRRQPPPRADRVFDNRVFAGLDGCLAPNFTIAA